MKKLNDRLDPKYTKICIYASVAVITTVILLMLIYLSGGFWGTLWSLFCAVLKPLVIGGIICYLLFPLVKGVESKISKNPKGITRVIAIVICLAAILAVLLILIIALALALGKGITSIDYAGLKESLTAIIEELEHDYKYIMDTLESELSSSLKDFPVGEVTGIVNAIVGGIIGLFSDLLFGVIFAIYFMLDWDNIRTYWGRAIKDLFGLKTSVSLSKFAEDTDRVFSGYIRGQFIDAFIMGVGTSVIFVIAGIPYGALVGVCVGIGNLIPYVGPVVGYVSLFVVCFISGAWDKLLIGILLMMIIMFVDGNIINPKLLSQNVEVHPLLVMVALMGGGAISGFLGMIVAVPVAALLKMQFDRYLAVKEGGPSIVDEIQETVDAIEASGSEPKEKAETEEKTEK